MACIAFLMDNKEGHIIPSFGLANTLANKGHAIIYLSIPDHRALINKQGFAFYPIFKNIYPDGFHQANKKFASVAINNTQREKEHLYGIMQGELDHFMTAHHPGLFIASAVLSLEVLLLHYKYGINPVILTTYLREAGDTLTAECLAGILELPPDLVTDTTDFVEAAGFPVTSLTGFLKPLEWFHELVLCPRELNINHSAEKDLSARRHHIGPCILQERKFGDRPDVKIIKKANKIIYASMGSYAVTYGGACHAFFTTLVNAMRHQVLDEFQLVLSVGLEFDTDTLPPIPANVTIVPWVSQVELLKEASLVITHGGLGTIKESIYYGVPMIVFPMGYDQPRNATLIEYHQLGISRRIEEITEQGLVADIMQVISSPVIANSIAGMKKIFREQEEANRGVQIIEAVLAGTLETSAITQV